MSGIAVPGRWLAFAAVLALLGAGCGRESEPAAHPPIVLVSIDSLRADRLGCYGAERDTSPAIDALAARGVRFANAVAPTSWTLPSHVTLLTGLGPLEHRVDRPEARIDPARDLLAEHLAAQGYRTAGFVSAPFLHRAYGFDRGFAVYRNFQGAGEITIPPTAAVHGDSHNDETAPQVIDAALEWLGAQPQDSAKPWFLFVHLWDVHYDFDPPAPYDRMFAPDYDGDLDVRDFEHNPAIHPDMDPVDLDYLRALYDGEIRWLDHQLGRLLSALEARSDERIVIALVADHGDEFFEHGEKGHMRNLHEVSVHVPFLLVDPGKLEPGVVDAVVGLDDVAPTLLGLAGLPPLAEATGRDLAPDLVAGRRPEGAKLLSLFGKQALRGDDWKILHEPHSGYAVYYDLASDPGEQRPQPARRVAAESFAELEAAHARALARAEALPWEGGADVELDAETRERLRRLGYVE